MQASTSARVPGRKRSRDRALYIETTIRAPMERIWELTQEPLQHVRWDARFTRIIPTHLRDAGAQEFRYELALGLCTIRGTGVSIGERRSKTGVRTSALVFTPTSALSPLGPGRGYWRYVPAEHGIRFFTGYDYAPGWGLIGRLLDPLITRRLVWWLTAWSFDRLRLWAEDGIEPERFSPWRVLLPGRGPRPRARRCLARPAGRRAIMRDAPQTLQELGQ